ncbi:hypothetical protein SLA2020_040360 [Shorea laevis]
MDKSSLQVKGNGLPSQQQLVEGLQEQLQHVIFSQIKLILAHMHMTTMGALEPQMRKAASLGLSQANEQQNQ